MEGYHTRSNAGFSKGVVDNNTKKYTKKSTVVNKLVMLMILLIPMPVMQLLPVLVLALVLVLAQMLVLVHENATQDNLHQFYYFLLSSCLKLSRLKFPILD